MRRGLDVLYAATRRKILRRDIGPRLSVVARDVKGTIVRTGPDHALFERRFRNCVERAVELLAGDIASDRLAAHALAALRVCREVRRYCFPRHTPISRAVQILRAVVEHVCIM